MHAMPRKANFAAPLKKRSGQVRRRTQTVSTSRRRHSGVRNALTGFSRPSPISSIDPSGISSIRKPAWQARRCSKPNAETYGSLLQGSLCHISMSGMPGTAGLGSGRSVIVASVRRSTLATDTAFSNAIRTTFVGSMIPVSTRSTY